MFYLKNKYLNVKIAAPNEECATSRFDRAGFITQVTLDGKYDFLGEEDQKDGKPSSGGMGLCSEIVCDPLSASVPVGGVFPKFGVGVLTKKENEPYYFMNPYQTEDFTIRVEQEDTTIKFITEPKEVEGYALYQEKTISISGKQLVIRYHVKNAGTKEISFEEYCHNFISLNHKKVGRDYYLTIPCLKMPYGEIKTNDEATTLYSDGEGLSKTLPNSIFSLYSFQPEQMKDVVPVYGWKMVDRKTGLCVEEADDFHVNHVTVWSVGDCMSPEMFFAAKLAPGEETSWTRTYTFSSDNQEYPDIDMLLDGNILRILKNEFLMNRNRDNLIAVLTCLKDSVVAVPTIVSMTDEAKARVDAGEPVENVKEGVAIYPNLVKGSNDKMLFPILSSEKEIPEGMEISGSLRMMPLLSVLQAAHRMPIVEGLVLDPFTSAMALPFDIADLIPMIERKTN